MFIPGVDPTRLADVLAGVPYPASTWQLVAQADYYGADRHTRTELSRLPVGTDRDLDAVVATLRDIYPSQRRATRRVPRGETL